MLAYKIAIFLILFNLMLPVVGALEVFPQVPFGETIVPASWDWISLVGLGAGLFAITASLIFRMPIGATIFAVVFTITTLPMLAVMNLMVDSYGMMPEIRTLFITAFSFIFLFAFIQLASTYTGQ